MSVVLVEEMVMPKYVRILLAASIVNVTVAIYWMLMDLAAMVCKVYIFSYTYLHTYIHVYAYIHVYLRINTLSTCVGIYMYIIRYGYGVVMLQYTPYHFEFYKVVILQLPARKELNRILN